jgi:hypothetical protein
MKIAWFGDKRAAFYDISLCVMGFLSSHLSSLISLGYFFGFKQNGVFVVDENGN